MRDIEEQIATENYDFVLDNMGYTEEPLEQRAVVFCRILRELEIPYKKYYVYPNHRYLRTQPVKNNEKFSGMGMVFIGVCEEYYAKYAIYLYKQRMANISKLNSML